MFCESIGIGVPIVTCGPLIGPNTMGRDDKMATLYITSIFIGTILQLAGQ
jgi:hypothetical protein